MTLHPLYGHEAVRARLANAFAAGRLPQALLIEGPRGVGKQRLALWLAQLVMCEAGAGRRDEPCGTCRGCRLTLALSHPDVAWYVPLEPSRKAADAQKQVDVVEEALGSVVAGRREQPLYEAPAGMAVHSIATVRLLHRRLLLTAALGGWRAVIVGEAERLVPQEANPEAANALLKALEEPPGRTVMILTAADPAALPPTILSRVVRVRLTRLKDSVVTAFAHDVLRAPENGAELTARVARAEGCIGRLLAPSGGSFDQAAAAAFLAAARKDPVARYREALRQTPYQARGGFTAMLDGLLARLREEVRGGADTDKLVAAIALVAEARGAAQGNVNPQLLAAVLADDLAARGVRAAEETGEAA
jgi:DNA polymerase-3 subunit delta'